MMKRGAGNLDVSLRIYLPKQRALNLIIEI
jgi:hypothetical protein